MRHIAVMLLLFLAWPGTATCAATRLKNYDLWKDLPVTRLMLMGDRFYYAGKADSALMCYNIVVNRYHSDDWRDQGTLRQACNALNQLGVLYTHYFNDNAKANSYLLEAQEIADKNGYTSLLASVYTNLGNIKLMNCVFGDTITAEQMQPFRQAFLTVFEAGEDPLAIFTSGFNWMKFLDDSAVFKRHHGDIELLLSFPLPDSLRNYAFVYDYARAILHEGNGNYEKSLQLLDSAYARVYSKSALSKRLMANQIVDNKCALLVRMGRNGEAVALLRSQLGEAEKRGDNYLSYIYSYNLFKHYRDIARDTATARNYEFMSLRYKDRFVNQSHQLDAERAEFLYEMDQVNAQVQDLAYRHRFATTLAWVIAAVTLVIVALLIMLLRRYRQEQAKNRKLYDNNLALLAAEDERRKQLIEQAAAPKYLSHQMEEGEQSDLLHRVLYIMETSEEIYQESFSLERLTELVDGGSRNYVSQVLNQHYGKSFPNVVNDYRIREACRRFNSMEQYGHLTVEGIARSVGFNSYSNFVSNFKRFTGLTPSAYRKQCVSPSEAGEDERD